MGLKANPLAKYLLRHPRFKHWMRLYYTTQSLWKLKEASIKGFNYKDFWQAGKSVHGIESVVSVAEVMQELGTGLQNLKQS
jgi:nitronate monooxygenase